MNIQPLIQTDFYKTSHYKMYPEGTTKLYSNFTPRNSRLKEVNSVVVFGIQYFVKEYLIKQWNENFFSKTKDEVISKYKRTMDFTLGKDSIDVSHIEKLHDLGYLPIEIKSLPEGTLCPIGIPCMTITNTVDHAYWLVNYLETIISCSIWQATTSATIAHEYYKLLSKYAIETSGNNLGVQWQGHDFSMRGMSSLETACLSGAGHLLSFTGTDTIPAISFLEQYYNADIEKELIGASVPATEHSVMCLGEKESEVETFRRLIRLYPSGILSIVSDTWSLWDVLCKILPEIKNEVLSRDGKLVIRPDSGDPVDIICGLDIPIYDTLEEAIDEFESILSDGQTHGEMEFSCDEELMVSIKGVYYELTHDIDWNRYDKQYYFIEEYNIKSKEVEFNPKYKGVIELLWDLFGGTVNEQGYKVLDSHIGAIYGDSITLERAGKICERLKQKGFASTNIVFGIGSFTYNCNTRDTFGFAMKATYGEVNGIGREIFKDPITDNGIKKSKKGLLKVYKDSVGSIVVKDQCTKQEESEGLLETIFLNSKLIKDISLNEIRENLKSI